MSVKNKYALIVFDWEGTLYDSAAYHLHVLKQTILDLKWPMFDEAEYEALSSLHTENIINALYSDFSSEERDQLKARFRLKTFVTPKETALFSDTRKVLSDLKAHHYQLAIATGKSTQGLESDLVQLRMKDIFSFTCTAEQTFSKPHPRMLYQIMDRLGVYPRNTLMIGDNVVDIQMGINAEVDSIGITKDLEKREALLAAGAKIVISSLSELLVYLEIETDKSLGK